MKVIDLFSGIGGFSYGLEMAGGFETVAFCEIDPFCREVLHKHWPEVAQFEDITKLTADDIRGLGRIDMVCGGFPCQPFSCAGKQKGKADDRYLWPHLARVIAEVRPDWLLLENVPGLRTIAADTVLADLEGLGYAVWPLVVGAWAVGAPHKRDRVWIIGMANTECYRFARSANPSENNGGVGGVKCTSESPQPESWTVAEKSARGCKLDDAQHDGREYNRLEIAPVQSGDGQDDRLPSEAGKLADADSAGLGELRRSVAARAQQPTAECRGYRFPAYRGQQQYEWEEPRVVYPDSAEWRQQVAEWCAESGVVAGRASDSGAVADPENSNGREAICKDNARRGVEEAGGSDRDHLGTPEPPLGGTTHGLPARLVRLASRQRREALKALGNSVVPQVVCELGRAINATRGIA